MATKRPLSQTFLRVLVEPSLKILTEVASSLEKDWISRGFKLRITPDNLLTTPFLWGEEVNGIPARYVALKTDMVEYGEMGIVYEAFEDFYPKAEKEIRTILEKGFGERILFKSMTLGYMDLFYDDILQHLRLDLLGTIPQLSKEGNSISLQLVIRHNTGRILVEIGKSPGLRDREVYLAKWFYESEISSLKELQVEAFRGREIVRDLFQKSISEEMRKELYG